MKTNISLDFAVAVLCGALLSLQSVQADAAVEGAKVGEWTQDYDAALKLAKKKDLPIMMNFTGSDWCHWCIHMDKNVFAKSEWKKFAATNAVLITIDFPRNESKVPKKYKLRNQTLQQKFGVRGYPTFVVMDSDGSTLLGMLGAGREKTPKSFAKEFKDATRFSARSVAAYVKANPGKGKPLQAAATEYREASTALDKWIGTNPPRNEENLKKYETMRTRIANAMTALQKFK